MPKQYSRNRRVADLVQRELATILQREIHDNRFGLVTVSAVDVSPDLKNARVYVTALGGNDDQKELLRYLNEMSGHFRHLLAGMVTLKSMPGLRFVYDQSIQRGNYLSELIDSLQDGDQNQTSDGHSKNS